MTTHLRQQPPCPDCNDRGYIGNPVGPRFRCMHPIHRGGDAE